MKDRTYACIYIHPRNETFSKKVLTFHYLGMCRRAKNLGTGIQTKRKMTC